MKEKVDIGMIGLAVMGENLSLNMEDKGYTVAVYNRTVPGVEEGVVERFLNGRERSRNLIGSVKIENFVQSIARPRKIMMMVKAGKPVDELIEQLLPLLDPGDILIDGGNSQFTDTIRRTRYLESKEMLFIGTGVSGGEDGALHGPSIMPGGSPSAWPHVKPILQAIAAKVDGVPCCDWVGENGAGHFVKMVHNGIEYGDMQLICEAYHAMKELLEIPDDEMHEVFVKWNLNYGGIAMLWRGGCIIRSAFLGKIKEAYDANPKLPNLLLDPFFKKRIERSQKAWRRIVSAAALNGIWVPAMSTALGYFDGFRNARLPANLLQAQRDYFGAHQYERIDRPRGEFFHTNWTGHGGDTASSSYTV